MEIKSAVAEFILEELAIGRTKKIDPHDDLFTTGLLDSLGVLQLVMFLEEQFSIKVSDEDVVFENFSTLSAIERYIQSRNITS